MLDLAPLLLYNFKDASCSVVSSELKGLLLWLSWQSSAFVNGRLFADLGSKQAKN